MELEHSFTVPVGIDRAWEVLLDVETIAPCMPGAALDTVDGDAFTGTVKVKLGPIGLTYKGKASFVEKDVAAHRAVIDAQGRDARGNGTANATVTATLTSDGEASTKVVVSTDLAITGKPAQFGRGVMADVGNKLIGQFADCLAGKLQEPALAAVASSAGSSSSTGDSPAQGGSTGDGSTGDGSAGDGSTGGGSGGGDAGSPPGGGDGEGGGSSEGSGSGAPAAESTSTATSAGTAGAAAAPTPSSGGAPKHSAGGSGPSDSPTSGGSRSGPRSVEPSSSPEPIDLMASAGPAVAKRLVPVAAALLAAVVLLVVRRRRG